jgi:hypothetical protein
MRLDITTIEALDEISAVQSRGNPTTVSQTVGLPVTRLPEQLRIHPALTELGFMGVVDEINGVARLTDPMLPDPILVTKSGMILAGLEVWRLALIEPRREVNCIEYSLDDDESLRFILAHHRSRREWNQFIRTCLALTLEPDFKQKALDNMRADR